MMASAVFASGRPGAPGNLIAQSALGEIGMSFGFFEYAIVGLPILAAGILFYATLGMKLLPNAEILLPLLGSTRYCTAPPLPSKP